jgi:hypothetical protein
MKHQLDYNDFIKELYLIIASLSFRYLVYVMYSYVTVESPVALLDAMENSSYRSIMTYHGQNITFIHSQILWNSFSITFIAILSPLLLSFIWYYYSSVLPANNYCRLRSFVCEVYLASILSSTPDGFL